MERHCKPKLVHFAPVMRQRRQDGNPCPGEHPPWTADGSQRQAQRQQSEEQEVALFTLWGRIGSDTLSQARLLCTFFFKFLPSPVQIRAPIWYGFWLWR